MARAGKLLLFSISFPVFLLVLCSDIVICHSNVRSLPGFTGSLPFHLETGYVGVDEANDVQLFYYFVKSERTPSEDPLILWITGGPGCSALTGLAFEIGPLYFKKAEYNGTLPTLELNPNSWTKVSNIIFIDAPVGTGFSYSSTLQGSHTGDIKSALQTYTFLKKWFSDHPDFLSNPLYIGGDSYSGMTIPVIAQDISDGNKAGDKPFMNLKGYLLGNPVTDINIEENSKIPYAYGMGLISNELYESTKKTCRGEYVNVDPSSTACLEKLQAVNDCTSGLNDAHILEPLCVFASPKPKEMVEKRRSLNDNSSKFIHSHPPVPNLECRTYDYMLSYYWANDDRVQKALNIRKGRVQEWVRCDFNLPYIRDAGSSLKYHQSLSERSYRSLIFSGDHDYKVPFLGTQAWIKSLNYPIFDDWRPWIVDGQVAGYTRTYANSMTFATVKGGGHTAPEYSPGECLTMFERWISHNPL